MRVVSVDFSKRQFPQIDKQLLKPVLSNPCYLASKYALNNVNPGFTNTTEA